MRRRSIPNVIGAIFIPQDKITVICNVIVRTARFTFTQNDYIPNGTLVDCSKLLIGQRSTVWQLCKDIVGADWE